VLVLAVVEDFLDAGPGGVVVLAAMKSPYYLASHPSLLPHQNRRRMTGAGRFGGNRLAADGHSCGPFPLPAAFTRFVAALPYAYLTDRSRVSERNSNAEEDEASIGS
jgi:hypothetical protein